MASFVTEGAAGAERFPFGATGGVLTFVPTGANGERLGASSSEEPVDDEDEPATTESLLSLFPFMDLRTAFAACSSMRLSLYLL